MVSVLWIKSKGWTVRMEGNELDTRSFSKSVLRSEEDTIIILFAIQPESVRISVATRGYHSISYTLLSNKNMGCYLLAPP
jgi:hypothetical protein